jgi:(p)ppGpp synthase/HD superfamily hydrolase
MNKGELLGNFLVFVTNAHAGQYDKGGTPYIMHCLKVLHYLRSEDEELQCIALAHDVVEDTETTYEDLRALGASERVIKGICAVTKVPGETLADYKARVFANPDAMRVKQADLRHNSDIRRLKGVTAKDFQRMSRYHEFYLEICQRLNSPAD